MIEIIRLIRLTCIVLGIIGGLEVVALISIFLVIVSRQSERRNRKKHYKG